MRTIGRRGLTLTEIILSAAIAAFVLCGIIVFFINCSFLNKSSRNLSTAVAHAQYIMEEIRDTNFIQVETNINNGVWDLDAAAIGYDPYNLAPLNNETIDTQVFQSGDPLGISIRVDWTDRGERARFRTLQTLMTDY